MQKAALLCRLASVLVIVVGGFFVGPIAARAADVATRVVLIGGTKSHGPAEHDFPNGIRQLAGLLGSSPDIRALKNVRIEAYPDGWPGNAADLEHASTIVWYFDGLHVHPLLDAGRRAQFERLMRQGVGLVALHQASTLLPNDEIIDLPGWLGGARYGMVDRTTETVELKPAAHAISRGVAAFSYRDEFYPTLRFSAGAVPVLSGELHFQSQNTAVTAVRPVAWAFERPGGGRSVGFTGLHYLPSLDQPQLRKLLLNAIVWTAGIDVPAAGVSVPETATRTGNAPQPQAEKTVTEAVVTRAADNQVIDQPWGRLTWYASRQLKNSDTMTVGQAVIRPGQENPRHHHPNCDEILHVVQGRILHTMGDRTVEMRAGDTVSIPTGVKHNARNIGTEDAVLAISFSSADRQVVGE